MTIEIKKLSPHTGAEILDVDLAREIDPDTAAGIYQAWLDHVVIVVRGQTLTQADLLRVAKCFGTAGDLGRPKEYRTKGHADALPSIMLVSNIRENGEPIGSLPDGDMNFHHDMLHSENPHKATLLYSVEVPSHGGNTLFANGYSAYDTLPDDLRAPLEDRSAFHHYNYGSTHVGDDLGTPAFSESTHPVFLTHEETGRKAVYVNRLMTEYVVDMDKDASAALLARLYDHSEQAEFVYEHVWQVGDLVVWDNRCSMHGRTDFPSDQRRLLWRVTIKGDNHPD
jgi:taurine dioxygenase